LTRDAETLARTLTGPYWQAQVLTALAVAAAQAGHHDHAETLARTITDPHRQASALTKLLPLVDVARARRLAGFALGIGRWPDVVERLGEVCEETIAAICDQLSAEGSTSLDR
jgi:hypothetical protein